jgi:hypothetical protein
MPSQTPHYNGPSSPSRAYSGESLISCCLGPPCRFEAGMRSCAYSHFSMLHFHLHRQLALACEHIFCIFDIANNASQAIQIIISRLLVCSALLEACYHLLHKIFLRHDTRNHRYRPALPQWSPIMGLDPHIRDQKAACQYRRW